MADEVMESECSGFGLEFNPDDSDCQGCKEGFPGEYEACKDLSTAKRDALAPDPVVDEEDVSLDEEVEVAESELDDDFDDESDELDVPVIPEEEDIEPPADLDDVEPSEQELDDEPGDEFLDDEPEPPVETKSKKSDAPKKFRRIETFAKLIREGESWIPSELANAVDMEADKTYKPGVTTVVVTQWLKLLLLIGIVEKLDGGLYRMKAAFMLKELYSNKV